MKNFIIVACFTLLIASCKPTPIYFENAICITHINTIDAENGLKKDKTIIIDDCRIIKLVKSDAIQLSESNQIIDATAKYMIPGLWDAHVHFAYIEELTPRMFDSFLAHGITSVRDTGGKLDLVKKWKNLTEQNLTYSLHKELVILIESGLTPFQTIASAAIYLSKYFSLENELGLIKE